MFPGCISAAMLARRRSFSATGPECFRESSTASEAWHVYSPVVHFEKAVEDSGRLCRDFRRNAQALQQVLDRLDDSRTDPGNNLPPVMLKDPKKTVSAQRDSVLQEESFVTFCNTFMQI